MAPHRDIEVTWRPISLLIKNQTQPDSPFYTRVVHTQGLLRVMESVRAEHGDGVIGRLYTAFGEHIHHQQDSSVDPAVALAEAGLPVRHAEAAHDDSWDDVIRASMDEGLGLTGPDVGTPILGITFESGKRVGFFGPVISRRLPLADALRLWDGVTLTAGIDCFWELKRTRTENPDFTPVD